MAHLGTVLSIFSVNSRTTNPNYKQEVDVLIEKRIKDVKYLLDNLSQLYEDKTKKTTFNQI